MISNTNCSDLELANKIVFLPGGYQPNFQYTISTPTSNNNNNNNNSMDYTKTTTATSTTQSQSTKPFIFYTAGCPILETNLTQKFMNNLSALKGGLTTNRRHDIDVVAEKTTGDTSSSSSSNWSNNTSDKQESSMCRTEDRENALFQIEDVHNYSKLSSSRLGNGTLCSSNSSNQDEDEDNEDDDENDGEEEEEDDDEDGDDDIDYEQQVRNFNKKRSAIERHNGKDSKVHSRIGGMQQHHQESGIGMEAQTGKEQSNTERSESPPDHHARRPMNAFLIFCKRHRSIVKAMYTNYENRSITKILGEWWASLDAVDKECYVKLANQNKKAFFSANPNFKWYKLPAPSLRTLNTRPGNLERPYHNSGDYQCDSIDSPIQNTSHHHAHNVSTSPYNRNELKKVPFFKLADETQMGDLNSLMQPNTKPPTGNENLQEVLGETTAYLKNGLKRKSNGSLDDPFSAKRLQSDNSFSSSEEDHIPKKTARSCKGKKYQELMNSGQIAAVIPKKHVPSKSAPRSTTMNGCLVAHNGHCTKNSLKEDSISPKKETPSKSADRHYHQVSDSPDSYASHSSLRQQQYSCVSFDLEDKIRALPAQSLESYLQRKKSTKHKKINAKKRSNAPVKPPSLTLTDVVKTKEQNQSHQPKTAQEVKEQIVGSQKRKARKESITRRDINSIQNDVTVLLSGGAVISNSGTTTTSSRNPIEGSDSATSDLHILAEVATMGIAQ